ncbi:DUF402 domain-containing protein [Streptomyces sp. HSW2009]|uniref:DUF402 domain-containing protein n=1 Tax=Streptomyces sp. HSW2009 TaxID=3142890 RepID=UPI0032EEE0F7
MTGATTGALPPGSDITVRLVKREREKVRYPARVIGDDGNHVVVRAPWAGAGVRDFGFVRFEHGDVFTEHYWRDRWFAIKEVRDARGSLKGWYCDVTRPAGVDGATLAVTDLDLDLWCSADGATVLRLDEDEFAESGLTEEDPQAAAQAWAALDALERLARNGGFGPLLAV